MVNVRFLHLDLGIGGAERLIVDAAVALKKQNHEVEIITTHHDRTHCFPETIDGTLPSILVVGDWLPRTVFGHCAALCSYIRMIYAALYIVLLRKGDLDVVVCDQVSACVPFLRLRFKKVIFYCHYPDLLLSAKGNIVKRIYRLPLNFIEEKTTGYAQTIFVNSEFTKQTFKHTFRSLNVEPVVLYPSINEQQLEKVLRDGFDRVLPHLKLEYITYFLSVNRFERKKNIQLALEAFTIVWSQAPVNERKTLKLIIAGGYDNAVQQNIKYYVELENRARDLEIFDQIIFLKSPNELEKLKLIGLCVAVIYTPENEHFGIVPLEGMYFSRPVIAVNNGGPTETILHKETGFLCESDEKAFAEAMISLLENEDLRKCMGNAGKLRFDKLFSFNAFSRQLNEYIIMKR